MSSQSETPSEISHKNCTGASISKKPLEVASYVVVISHYILWEKGAQTQAQAVAMTTITGMLTEEQATAWPYMQSRKVTECTRSLTL